MDMRPGAFFARTGLTDVTAHRLVKAGVLQPVRPGPGRGYPGLFSDQDVVAAIVWAHARKVLTFANAVEAAVCARYGSPFVLVFADAVVPAADLYDAVELLNRAGGVCTLIDVAKLTADATVAA